MLPALIGRIMRVHPVQVAGKEGCFIATGSGADFNDRVAGIRRVRRHEPELHLLLQLRHFHLESRNFLARHLDHLRVIPLGQRAILPELISRLEIPLALRNQFLQACVFAAQLLSAPVVFEHLGIAQLGFHFRHALGEFLDVRLQVHVRELIKKKPPATAQTGRAAEKIVTNFSWSWPREPPAVPWPWRRGAETYPRDQRCPRRSACRYRTDANCC